MKRAQLSTVSALALTLALAAPAGAQQTADEPAAGTTQAGDQAPRNIGMSVAELHELMTDIGVDDAEVFGGDAVMARTREGHPAIMFIGPQDFALGETDTLGVGTFRDLREQMADAGFQDVTEARGWQPLQGTLDNHTVFVADPVWGPDEPIAGLDAEQTGESAEFGIGEPTGEFDREGFGDAIDQTGLENTGEVQGQLVRARTGGGQSFMLVIGPESFAADQEIELSEDELRERLEGAGLTSVEMVEQDTAMYRGSYSDMAVLMIAGPGVSDERMQTGTARQPTEETDGIGMDQED